MTETTDFYNPYDGTKGRPEGVYLDVVERINAEKSRAIVEDREPDLSSPGNLPPACSTPVNVAAQQVDNSYYSNPATVTLGAREVDPIDQYDVDYTTPDDVALDEATAPDEDPVNDDGDLLTDDTTTTTV